MRGKARRERIGTAIGEHAANLLLEAERRPQRSPLAAFSRSASGALPHRKNESRTRDPDR
jgi:hypothetical protein